jgi:S-formylglutathione hydrolase FrmB
MKTFRAASVLAAFRLGLVLTAPPAPLAAELVHDSIMGSLTKAHLRFTVALPDDYAPAGGPYPVVYHLHGIGGNEAGNQTLAVPRAFEAARGKGLIGPVIVVFADGRVNSMWADSKDMSKPVETNLIRELVPHIDSVYRTRTDRGGRFIQGFSMGGFGAAKCMAKYPDLFRACVIYDGALLAWKEMKARHPDIVRDMFAGDSAYFAAYSPFDLLRRNASIIGGDFPVKMAVGSLLAENRAFRDSLAANGLRPAYAETGCAHALPCLLDAEGENAARMYGTLLATPTALPADAAALPIRAFETPVQGKLRRYDASGRSRAPAAVLFPFPDPSRTPPAERTP